MKFIGAHISISKGFSSLKKQMDDLNAETCAFFLKNPSRFDSNPIREDEIKKFKELDMNTNMLLPHGSYLINLVNYKENARSFNCFLDDLERCNSLGIKLYNFHPGSDTLNKGIDKATKEVADAINIGHSKIPNVVVCIEIMAGQGNTIGRSFEQIRQIIDNVEDKDRVGVVLDTCHMFCAGYDIRKAVKFESVMNEFKHTVGLKYLKGVHLNDSKKEFNARKDRHMSLGKGFIGLECFRYIMNSKEFDGIPLVLETPDPSLYYDEIKMLKSMIE